MQTAVTTILGAVSLSGVLYLAQRLALGDSSRTITSESADGRRTGTVDRQSGTVDGGRTVVSGKVISQRAHGKLAFIDVETDNKQHISIICEEKLMPQDYSWKIRLIIADTEAEFHCETIPDSKYSVPRLHARDIVLTKAKADPAAVGRVIRLVVDGIMSVSDGQRALRCQLTDFEEVVAMQREVLAMEQLPESKEKKYLGWKLRRTVRLMSLRLAGRVKENGEELTARNRVPFVNTNRHKALIAKYESLREHWPLKPIGLKDGIGVLDCDEDGPDHGEGDQLEQSAPVDPITALPAHVVDAERKQYCEGRKRPQIAWMLNQLEERFSVDGLTVLDVGCGRGDLALNAAVRFPTLRVLALDANLRSLQAGRDRAHALGLSNLQFLHCDFVRAWLTWTAPSRAALWCALERYHHSRCLQRLFSLEGARKLQKAKQRILQTQQEQGSKPFVYLADSIERQRLTDDYSQFDPKQSLQTLTDPHSSLSLLDILFLVEWQMGPVKVNTTADKQQKGNEGKEKGKEKKQSDEPQSEQTDGTENVQFDLLNTPHILLQGHSNDIEKHLVLPVSGQRVIRAFVLTEGKGQGTQPRYGVASLGENQQWSVIDSVGNQVSSLKAFANGEIITAFVRVIDSDLKTSNTTQVIDLSQVDDASKDSVNESFEYDDPSAFAKVLNPSSLGRVVVVGLHACGGLTDLCLNLVARLNWNLLLTPCCFFSLPTLHHLAHGFSGEGVSEADSRELRKLCEVHHQDAIQVAVTAMHSVNALRMDRLCSKLSSGPHRQGEILCFDQKLSVKNMVLFSPSEQK